MNIRWIAGLVIMAAVVAFQTVGADEVQQKKQDKIVIQGTILYADTGTPVLAGKRFDLVDIRSDGSMYQLAGEAIEFGVTDTKGFLRMEAARSKLTDPTRSFTLVSYPKNSESQYPAVILNATGKRHYLPAVGNQESTIDLNKTGKVFYNFPMAFDSMEKIPVLNADFDSLKFFEGGDDIPEKSQRVYKKRFAQKETRYINWELNLKYNDPGRRIDFDLQFVCKRANTGEIIANQKMNGYINSAWTSSYHNQGWGNKTPGAFWKPGVYTLSVYINGNPVAMESFEVY